jgi:hypothetical protein
MGALSLGVKQPWHESDHSLLSSDKVKNGGAIPALHFKALYLINQAQGQIFFYVKI